MSAFYNTKLPGSTCKMVFTLSRKTFALFSSPLGTVTLKTFVDDSDLVLAPAKILGVLLSPRAGFVPVIISMISGCFKAELAPIRIGADGSAVTCGVKLPLEVFTPILSRPSTWSKSSSALGFENFDRGRSSLAISVARATNMESGRVTPRVDWMRFWTSRTAFREIGTAISVSGSGAGVGGTAAEEEEGGAACLGGAIFTLLRSR